MTKISKILSLPLFSIALASLASTGMSRADDYSCGAVAGLLTASAEQELFYWSPDKTWMAVPAGGLDLTTSEARLIYVTKELFANEPRSGAIVVKTARTIASGAIDPAPIRKRINLNRLRQEEFETCQRSRDLSSFQGSVSALEYDWHHDYGYDASNNNDGYRLTQFHTGYAGRRDRCKETDNTTFDAPLRWDWRSNRSQFSFDQGVVSGGFNSQIMAGLHVRGAEAVGSVGLADQRVDIIKYRTNAQNMACIPVRVKLTGANFFIRINDLEGAPGGTRLIRADELSRQLRR
jgi:hypothetical protein